MSKPVAALLRLLPLGVLGAAMGVLSPIWAKLSPPPPPIMGVGVDKIAHAVCAAAIFAAALPAMRGFLPTSSFRARALLTGLLLMAAGCVSELHQLTQPARHAEWGDIAANFVGIGFVALACYGWGFTRQTRSRWARLGAARRPSTELLEARRLLGPLATRFVGTGKNSGTDSPSIGAAWFGPRVTPDTPELSSSLQVGRHRRLAPATPSAAHPATRRTAHPGLRCAERAERRAAVPLPSRGSETISGAAPNRPGFQRRRSQSQRGSRRGARTRTPPCCRAPRHRP